MIRPLIYSADARRGRGRLRDPDSARGCLDTIRYLLKAGCLWSIIPSNLALRSTALDALRTKTCLMLLKRHAQRRYHRQPDGQRRATTSSEQRLRRGRSDQRPQAPCAYRHQRLAPGRGGHARQRATS
ncbi:MAG: hypothetical protein K1X78_18650 [Verrucomicrobiaceae bacterium]|nr:hypothetical protein [Verrucomicrobiaceae bacterium]